MRNISQLCQKLCFFLFIYPGILQTDDVIVKYLLNRSFRLQSRGSGAEIVNNDSGSGSVSQNNFAFGSSSGSATLIKMEEDLSHNSKMSTFLPQLGTCDWFILRYFTISMNYLITKTELNQNLLVDL